MDYSHLITDYEMRQDRAEATEWLDQLSTADSDLYWSALWTAARETVVERRELGDWLSGEVVNLGGGSWLVQTQHADEDCIELWARRAGLGWRLATVAWFSDRDGLYGLCGAPWAYAHEVRSFRRALRSRNGALTRAYYDAREALGDEHRARLDRARALIETNAVTLNADGTASVKSQNGGGPYTVGRDGCNCPDAQYQAQKVNGRPACKHQLATWLYRRIETPNAAREAFSRVLDGSESYAAADAKLANMGERNGR